MEKSTVFANKQGITHKGSGAESISGPDVCLTPVGKSQVPIPYTNVARSSTLARGSKSVFINGHRVAIAGSCYGSSTGDQAGTGKGLLSGAVGDKAVFINWSSDVRIEGKGVCRNGDLMIHNNGNAIGRNRDACADPPPRDANAPAMDSVRIRVVEHLSWQSYDKQSGKFYPGNANNKPIACRAFKLKLPDGKITDVATNEEGIIELSGQDPHGHFELTFEPEKARLNSKYFLFSRAITPIKKDIIEQDDPRGETVKHTKDDILTGVNYVVSIYQPCVIVDCHMHIMSGNCSTLPFLWEQPGVGDGSSREAIEWRGKLVYPKMVGEQKRPTDELGNNFVTERLNKALEEMEKQDTYAGVPRLLYIAIPLTMDMEYAHIDGYFGLKVYNAVYDEKNNITYWSPWHGKDQQRDNTVYSVRDDNHPLEAVRLDGQTQEEFKKNEKHINGTGIPGVYYNEKKQQCDVNIKAAARIMPATEGPRYEKWEKQLRLTELAMLANPLKLLPLLHFDPRRWQVVDNGLDKVFEQVTGSGLYLGFKMYTAQGYRPWDVQRLPILKDFYSRCCVHNIPVVNHCTPDGSPTYDRKNYYGFIHPNDPPDDLKKRRERVRAEDADLRDKGKYPPGYFENMNRDRETGQEDFFTRTVGESIYSEAERYFNYDFVAPKAWEEVLRHNRGLRLCLAHFGGNTVLGRKWGLHIMNLIKANDNVYADISSSFADVHFREYFKEMIWTDGDFKKKLRNRILFGTDWYMTLLGQVDYGQYCRDAKRFLDEFESSLWIRFTQVNPYKFYRLDLPRIREIAGNIIQKRQTEDVINALKKDIKKHEIDSICQEAEYIMNANMPLRSYLETYK